MYSRSRLLSIRLHRRVAVRKVKQGGTRCWICGYNGASHNTYADEDGVVRCLICRQKAKYGHVLGDNEVPVEIEEWKKYLEECSDG